MRKRIEISQAKGRCMCHQYIDPFILPDLPPEFSDPPGHLFLRVHVDSVRPVAVGTAQPRKTETAVQEYGILDTDTPFRRVIRKRVIVVPADIQKRTVSQSDQKFR